MSIEGHEGTCGFPCSDLDNPLICHALLHLAHEYKMEEEDMQVILDACSLMRELEGVVHSFNAINQDIYQRAIHK